jgi:hypothetical protein
VLAVADLSCQVGAVGEVAEQLAQQAGRLMEIVARPLEQLEQAGVLAAQDG